MSNTNTIQPRSRRSIIPSLSLTSMAIAMALSTTPIFPSPANASAYGCTPKSRGNLCHRITGYGKRIKRQAASHAGYICNWRIDFVYNKNGKGFRRDKGKTRNSCTTVAKRVVTKDKKLKHYGQACAVLFSNGRKVGRQCHNILKG